MSLGLTAAILASALVHAGWNALVKGGGERPLVHLVALSLGWVALSPLILGLLPWPHASAWPYLLTSVLLHVVYVSLLSAAYSHGDLGLVYPIVRGTPPLLIAGAGSLWLGEPLVPLGMVGILSISAGLLLLTRSSSSRPATRAILYACATALMITSYIVVDGVGVRASGSVLGYVAWLSALQGALFSACALAWQGRSLWSPLRTQLGKGFATGLLAGAGYAVALWAMTSAPIALVAALRETSVIFGAALSTVVLHEPFGRRRLVAAAFVALGAACIQLSG